MKNFHAYKLDCNELRIQSLKIIKLQFINKTECKRKRTTCNISHTRERVFHNISKHREESLKYDAQQSILDDSSCRWFKLECMQEVVQPLSPTQRLFWWRGKRRKTHFRFSLIKLRALTQIRTQSLLIFLLRLKRLMGRREKFPSHFPRYIARH